MGGTLSLKFIAFRVNHDDLCRYTRASRRSDLVVRVVAIGHANLVRLESDGRILDLIQQVSRLYWSIGRGVSYSRYGSRNRRVDLIPRAYTLRFPFSSFYCLMGHARRGACQTILRRQLPLSESTSSMFRLLVRSQLRFDLYLCGPGSNLYEGATTSLRYAVKGVG